MPFSLFADDFTAAIGKYRKDLKRLGNELDIASLPCSEQPAFWLNLLNAALIEQIGRAERFKVTIWEDGIADLARVKKQMVLGNLGSTGPNTPFLQGRNLSS